MRDGRDAGVTADFCRTGRTSRTGPTPRKTCHDTRSQENNDPVLSRHESGSRAIVRKVRPVRQVRKSRQRIVATPALGLLPVHLYRLRRYL